MGETAPRLAQAARDLAQQGLDGLVAVTGAQNSFLESNPVFVLSGVRPIGESAVVVDRDGRSTLIVTPAWDGERAAAASRTGKTIGTDDLVGTLAAAISAHTIDNGKTITVGLATVGVALAQQIEAALGGKSRPRDGYVRELARIRSAQELAAARKATEIAERGYAGVRLEDIADELGMLKGSLYYWVDSKEDLLKECIGHGVSVRHMTRMEEIRARAAPASERLRMLMRLQLGFPGAFPAITPENYLQFVSMHVSKVDAPAARRAAPPAFRRRPRRAPRSARRRRVPRRWRRATRSGSSTRRRARSSSRGARCARRS